MQRENYIISPYFDYLSFFFNREWKFPAQDILSLMIKLADENGGGVAGKDIQKTLTPADKERLQDGARLCTEIWRRFGVPQEDLFLGTINAGHPGGMLPLTQREATTLHRPDLPDNLYVADASLFPESMGNPPILTIMALAMRVGKVIAAKFG